MQRQGSMRLLLIAAITIISIVLLIPTFRYFSYISGERPADPAQLEAWLAKANEMRQGAIPLGLDLQGGTDIVLKVDLDAALEMYLKLYQKDIQEAFKGEPINATVSLESDASHKQVIDIKLHDPSQFRMAGKILERFDDVFRDWDRGKVETEGVARLSMRPDVVQNQAEQTIDGARKSISERVDALGVTQASTSKQGNDRIRVQIPGEKNPDEVIENIIKIADLKFHLVYGSIPDSAGYNSEHLNLRNELFENGGVVPEGKTTCDLLPDKSLPTGYIALPGEDPQSDPLDPLPRVMYIVKEDAELGGDKLDNAYVTLNYGSLDSMIVVSLEFDREGGRIFHRVTRDNEGKQLAIALDGVVFSAPRIDEAIADGKAIIRGNFSNEEAKNLSLVLKAGALPAKMEPVQEGTVEATLGADSIKASLKALTIGGAVVVVFMIVYYGTGGVIAVFALILNVLIVMAIMSMAGATLTLSGIGGLLLTIGMAVDANVLIYERIREELRAGKPVRAALSSGFNRAFSVILDSNLTTMLTALILLQFGEGSVKGFALTMTFGLLANLFTGLTVTFTLCEAWFNWRNNINLGFIQPFTNTRINFIGMRKGSFVFSSILIVASIVVLIGNKGPNMAVDFEGGLLYEAEFAQECTTTDINAALEAAGLTNSKIQKYADTKDALIRARLVDDNIEGTKEAIDQALTAAFGAEGFNRRGASAVTSEVGQEFYTIAWVVILCASAAILIYLALRFERTFGVAAVIALVHDLFLTLGIVTLCGVEISLDVVSAFLILLGYSANDTIVIFDRIRENARDSRGKDLKDICNASMNQSLTRTLITSLTTAFVMLCMYSFGGHSLQPFALTLIVGMFFGTYSSSFIAAPTVYEWTTRKREGVLALAKATPTASGGTKRGRRAARPSSKRSDATT